MNTTIQIQPVQFYPTQATYLLINDVYVDLVNQVANCQYTYLDSGYNSINSSVGRYYMDSGTYQNWNSSDSFFLSAVVSGLGLASTS